jgi:hypothetical protein
MSEDTPFGITAYHSFFMQYGQFLGAWNSFDVLVEIALMRELRLTEKQACTVFASIGFGAKCHILGALLIDTEEGKRKYSLILQVVQLAERNSFVHGFISVSDDAKSFTLVRREVKGSLEIRPKIFTPLLMQKHLHIFGQKMEEAQSLFSITDADLIKYQREVESFAKASQAPDTPRPESATSFAEAKRLSRRERRTQKKARRSAT